MKPKTTTKILTGALPLVLCVFTSTAPAADQTATWNGTTGNWSDFTKWNTNPLFANNGNGGFTFDAVQSAGTLTVDQAITIEKLTMGGGTNTGTGFTLTTNDLFTFSDGVLNGTGIVQADGGVTLSGATSKEISGGRTLSLAGGTTWSGGQIRLGTGGTITNQAGATFDTNFDGTVTNFSVGSSSVFNNAGTLTKSDGDGATIFGNADSNPVVFNNTGTVNANSGVLAFNGGGTNSGIYNVAAGATLAFGHGTVGTGTHNMNTGTQVLAADGGTVSFGGGTANFNAGTYNVLGTTTLGGGTANFDISASTKQLTFTSGTLGGTGSFSVSGAATWSGGFMTGAGSTNILDSITLDTGSSKQLNSSRVLNIGDGVGAPGSVTATWTAGALDLRSGGTMNIKADGAFSTNFDGTINNGGGGAAGVINVEAGGSFTKSGGALITQIGTSSNAFTFNNNGTVAVQTGTLRIGSDGNGNGGTHTGTFDLSGGATLHLQGSHTLVAGTSFTGAGTALFSGNMTANGALSITSGLTLTGTLGGTGTVNVSGPVTWSGGFMTGAGSTNILDSITLDTGSSKQLNSSRVLNIGDGVGAPGSVTATWTAGALDLRNGGTMNIKADGAFSTNFDGQIQNGSGSAGFVNVETGGSFTKSGGALSTQIGTSSNPLTFSNAGTVTVQSGTLLIGGTINQHAGTTLTGGTWNVSSGSALDFSTGSNINTIGSAASVTLDGAGSSFAKVTTALNNNQGSFTLKNDRDLTTAGNLANSGLLSVQDSTTTLTIGSGGSGIYTQTAGETLLVGSASITASAFFLNGGELSGNGTINASVTTSGAAIITPGLSPGLLTINGALALNTGSTLIMEVGGLTQGSTYDHLDINGALSLGGMLDLAFFNGFENDITETDIFTLASANDAITGSFLNVLSGERLDIDGLGSFEVWYGSGSAFGDSNLVLANFDPIPETSSALLVAFGTLGLLQRRRRPARMMDTV